MPDNIKDAIDALTNNDRNTFRDNIVNSLNQRAQEVIQIHKIAAGQNFFDELEQQEEEADEEV